MSNLTELKIKNSKKVAIQKLANRGLKQEMVTELGKDGKPFTKITYINPEVIEENRYLVKDLLMETVYKLSQKELDDLDVQEYDQKLKDILDYATENEIEWIINLKLNKEHLELASEGFKKKAD